MRFRIDGQRVIAFGDEHIAKLAENAIGTQRVASGDGSSVGWIAGGHIFDTTFDLAKNVVNDALHFALRVDEVKLPADVLRAYYEVELKALAASNPSGFASAKQKRQAREYAKDRLEQEAKDGRYLRRKAIPVLWDAAENELLFGTTSTTVIDRLVSLLYATFGRKLELIGAGWQAYHLAVDMDNEPIDAVEAAGPAIFVNGGHDGEIAWEPDTNRRDFLGNEFLLWLWYYLETTSDELSLSDGTAATVMISRSLQLECPRGQFGRESFNSDGPSKLPESRRAIQAGKLPRKIGLTVVRQHDQYELTLQAETMAISGAKMPAPEAESQQDRQVERVNQLRHLRETLDLMYEVFLTRRLGATWPDEVASMREWLRVEQLVAG
jgi:hypothetical protein